jgi:DDE domain
MNNMIEQDHRYVKKRIVASQWFWSVDAVLNTITGYEAINIIRKRTDPLAAKDRHCGPGAVRRAHPRHRGITDTPGVAAPHVFTSPFATLPGFFHSP